MKFTPELPFAGGKLRGLSLADKEILFELYQQPELPGQSKPADVEAMTRIVDYSIKASATQRGMMWLLEVDNRPMGLVNAFDWQPSWLRLTLRVDALPELSLEHRQAALQAAIEFLGKKFHVNNFAYQWIEGQPENIKTMLDNLGFKLCATMRDAWRVGEQGYANVEQYHLLTHQDKPKAGRLGEFDDNPGQNLAANAIGGEA